MANGLFHAPPPVNEPVYNYAPGSPERAALKAELKHQSSTPVDIPLVIGGREVRGKSTAEVTMPHQHRHAIATYHNANTTEVETAITTAVSAQRDWSRLPWEDRAAVFLKAAELLCGKYRQVMNAATMLGQSKTCYQAEIDAACELADFWRFNVHFMTELYRDQPISSPGVWNRIVGRGLEGFVFAVTPFNFSSIALNLATAPALMGCGVVWKPAATGLAASWVGMQILREAGLPDGVVNMLSGDAAAISAQVLANPHLAGIHFTGSTGVFNSMWQTVGQNINKYRAYPRLVGETGGKDFVFAHPSADASSLVTALVRGAFEYQGQKCSAASRAYIPKSLWPRVQEALVSQVSSLSVGDPADFRNFMGAVIDKRAFSRLRGAIEESKKAPGVKVLVGGETDDSVGYFIKPTVLVTEDPKYRTMSEELFGPVLTIYVYDDAKLDETLVLADQTSPYALTGAIFAQDRLAIQKLTAALEQTAGNFYINDKPTGAVVGQQPFGGARASGTNDKAGSKLNLTRWMSQRTIKETFVPPTNYAYAHMTEP